MIRPYVDRHRSSNAPLIVGSAVVLLLAIAGSGVLGVQALEGRAAAARPVNGAVPLCPAAATEPAR